MRPPRRASERSLRLLGRPLPDADVLDQRPDWAQATAKWINDAVVHSQALSSGGWHVLDSSRALREKPRSFVVAGRTLVAWRDRGELRVAPDACPHLGASLAAARVKDGRLICPWHGLSLGPEGHAGWRPLPSHDDGVLIWVRIDGGEPPTLAPVLPVRPRHSIDAVIRLEARCEPRDVVANRLDPWHGAHLHPYSFAALRVIALQPAEVTVRVAYRLLGAFAIEVDARFHCSDARTIVMTIVRGEGEGSIVETHATPVAPGRTSIVEATLAASQRRGFAAARRAAALLRPLIRHAARRLWVDDAAYAERLYSLRRDPA